MKNTITEIVLILLGFALIIFKKPIVDTIIESNTRLFGNNLGGGTWWPRQISYWAAVFMGLVVVAFGILTLFGVIKVK